MLMTLSPVTGANRTLAANALASTTPAPGASESSRAVHDPIDSVELGSSQATAASTAVPERTEAYRKELGETLWARHQEGRIDLLPVQVSGRNDGADARSNIADTAVGRQAKRSSYGNAPGGRVALSFPLLEGLKTFSEDYTFRITALAGGSHSARSRHYLGVSFDIDTLNGQRLSKDHPDFRSFMALAHEMGATEVLGPGDAGHNTHIHISWPRDAAG